MANPNTPAAKPPGATKVPAFVFIGDKTGHGPDEIKLYGLTFSKNGKPVPVEDAMAAKKLANNGHFKAA